MSQRNPSTPDKTKAYRHPSRMATQGTGEMRSPRPTLDRCRKSPPPRRALWRKPLGDGLAGAGPVAALANAQKKTKCPEGSDGVREAGQHADERPPDDRQGKPQARANDVEQDAANQPHAGVRDLKSREDSGKIGVAEVQFLSDDRRQHGESLAADVIDDRGTEERPYDPPANSLRSHRQETAAFLSLGSSIPRMSRHNVGGAVTAVGVAQQRFSFGTAMTRRVAGSKFKCGPGDRKRGQGASGPWKCDLPR